MKYYASYLRNNSVHIEEMHSVENTKKKRERRGKGERRGGGGVLTLASVISIKWGYPVHDSVLAEYLALIGE